MSLLLRPAPLQTLSNVWHDYWHIIVPSQVFALLWYLFSKRYFPLNIARYVGRFLFLPTFPATYIAHTLLSSRFGPWMSKIDKQGTSVLTSLVFLLLSRRLLLLLLLLPLLPLLLLLLLLLLILILLLPLLFSLLLLILQFYWAPCL